MARSRSWWLPQVTHRSRRRSWRPFLEALEDRLVLSTITVTDGGDTTGSAGDVTLRYAINQVNAGNFSEIDFAIGPQGSAQTITLTSALPALTANGVYINGLSQGASGNTTPLIQLNGGNLTGTNEGLQLGGSGCTVSGLNLSGFTDGLYVTGANNLFTDNYLGTNLSGTAPQSNTSYGIYVNGANNTIGGSVAGVRNVISGNGSDGVYLDSGASGTLVAGNYVGTDATGKHALQNSVNGIEVNAANVTLGGTVAAARNLISGNSFDGVILYTAASNVLVEGNYVGTNAAGTAARRNGFSGVEVDGVNNTIGGTVAAARNLISGNSFDGVLLNGGASGNVVEGNYIGTNKSGKGAVANSNNGVEVAAESNLIGGATKAARNVISGNGNDGVLIDNGVLGVTVQNNYIGTDATGAKALANSNNGVEIMGINPANRIIGFLELIINSINHNVISGNTNDGILIDTFATNNQVTANIIGLNAAKTAAVPNGLYGVQIDEDSSNNTIGGSTGAVGNIIADNAGGGVVVSSSFGDTIRHNSIFANGSGQQGPGITLNNNTNGSLAAPVLSSATYDSTTQTLTVTGTFTAPTAKVKYVLEFFANIAGDAEGKVFAGTKSVTPKTAGTISFTFTFTTAAPATGPLITATVTDNNGDTSAFSNGVTS